MQEAGSVSIDVALRQCDAPALDAAVSYSLQGRGHLISAGIPFTYSNASSFAHYSTLVPVPADLGILAAAAQRKACQDAFIALSMLVPITLSGITITGAIEEGVLALCTIVDPLALPLCEAVITIYNVASMISDAQNYANCAIYLEHRNDLSVFIQAATGQFSENFGRFSLQDGDQNIQVEDDMQKSVPGGNDLCVLSHA